MRSGAVVPNHEIISGGLTLCGMDWPCPGCRTGYLESVQSCTANFNLHCKIAWAHRTYPKPEFEASLSNVSSVVPQVLHSERQVSRASFLETRLPITSFRKSSLSITSFWETSFKNFIPTDKSLKNFTPRDKSQEPIPRVKSLKNFVPIESSLNNFIARVKSLNNFIPRGKPQELHPESQVSQ